MVFVRSVGSLCGPLVKSGLVLRGADFQVVRSRNFSGNQNLAQIDLLTLMKMYMKRLP